MKTTKEKVTSQAGERTRDSFVRGMVDFTKCCPKKGCLLCSGHPDAHQFKKTKAAMARDRADSLTEQLHDFLEKLEAVPTPVAKLMVANLEEVFLASAITGDDAKGHYWELNKLDATEGFRAFLCAVHGIEGRSQSQIEAQARK